MSEKYFLSLFIISISTAKELIFENCNEPGWTCTDDSPDSLKITYSCNLDLEVQKVNLSLSKLSLDALVTNFTITGCEELHLDFHTPTPPESLKYFSVERINSLYLEKSKFEFHPVNLIFEDVVYVEEVPPDTFRYSKTEDVAFRRINFGSIKPRAFDLKYLNSFVWEEITVTNFSAEAVRLTLQDQGVFRFSDCIIDNVKESTIFVRGGNVIVDRCVFNELSPYSINANSGVFFFIGNRINGAVENCALNVTSNEVYLENNWIHHVKSSGLKCISSNGKKNECPSTSFQFYLRLNHIEKADDRSLEATFPNRDCFRYFAVANNTFTCDLNRLRWISLMSRTNPNDPADLAGYYRKIMAVTSNNICAGASCHLPIAVAIQIADETGDSDPNKICQHYEGAVFYDVTPKLKNNTLITKSFSRKSSYCINVLIILKILNYFLN